MFVKNGILQRSLAELEQLGARHTSSEIVQQPQLWSETLQRLDQIKAELELFISKHRTIKTKVIFTGAGTSEFVGNTVVPYLQSHGQQNMYSISSTDLVLAPESYISKHDEVLLISCARSGNSPESLAAATIVEEFSARCAHLLITCNPKGALAINYQNQSNAYVFIVDGANDKGFAMTSSFTCMTLVCSLVLQIQLLANWQRFLPPWLEAVAQFFSSLGEQICKIADIAKTRVICLGSAENKGIAQEAHLKILELSASKNTANFDSPLGFRHGPKSVMNHSSMIFFFCSNNIYTHQYEQDMLRELMATSGGHYVIVITSKPVKEQQALCHKEIIVPQLPAVIAEAASILNGLTYISVAQFYALENSIQLGIRPDDPSPSGLVNRVVQGVKIYPHPCQK